MDRLKLMVNGEEHVVEVAPGEMLSDVLRYRLGLTGTKIACEEAECGACTVLLEDQPVLSCTMPAMKTDGKTLLTIEGLRSNGELHPLQDAFVKHGAVQCGFCIPGQIMTGYALLTDNQDPSEEDIRYALRDTLCRCGAYPRIITAVQAAAQSLRSGSPVSEPVMQVSGDERVVGRYAWRPDAIAKVDGTAMYSDDYEFPGMLHGAVLRAGVPHGIVRAIELEQARAVEGVHTILTAPDVPGRVNHGVVYHDWPALVGIGEKVRYVGDAIAIVVADTRGIAEQALGRIGVEIEALPVVTDPVEAYQSDAPRVHQDGNLLKHIKVRKGDVDLGFEQADVILDRVYFTPAMDHVFMEPECSIARITDDDRVEVYVGSQIPYEDREQIAAALGVDESRVRVIGTLIGGGFGGKEDIAGQIHAALAAYHTGRPVKILFDRHESLIVHPKRHATQIRVRLGAKRDGTLVAAQTELYGDTGAYASLGDKVMGRATTHSAGPYVIPHVKSDCYAMYTNNPPAGAFRGFGALQSIFAIETAMDELAEMLDIERVTLRRKNALRKGSIANTGQILDESVGLIDCIERVQARLEEVAGKDPFTARQVVGEPHLSRAWGFAVAFKNTGLGEGAPDRATAEVELLPDGTVEARTSSAEIGQGLVTVLQLIAAEEMGLPLESVRVLLSDTDLTPDGGPTTGSRQTYISGNAVRHAASALRDSISATLAEKFEVPPGSIRYVEGLAQVNGQQIMMDRVASIMNEEGRKPLVSFEYWAPETYPLGTEGDKHFAFSFAAQAAEVEVDLLTGEVRVLRVIAANDVGRAINPLGLLGQVEGGVIMGVGHALTEEFILEGGEVWTDQLARYRMPSIAQTPEIESIVVEHPTSEGPYGAKGVGEISSMPTIPAITNAIYNACGVRLRKIPVDQDWLALEIARKAPDGA
ncbi:MAG: molybdopterin-dependent oxidoreductase [Anaerolineales bacterium]|nr:molybdopterin-dependent oxidoreductase [Anaerolineales bacterium]